MFVPKYFVGFLQLLSVFEVTRRSYWIVLIIALQEIKKNIENNMTNLVGFSFIATLPD